MLGVSVLVLGGVKGSHLLYKKTACFHTDNLIKPFAITQNIKTNLVKMLPVLICFGGLNWAFY